MTYVMSDIHGEYGKYIAMLEKIRFSDNDDLYILGDIVDRGPEPVRVLHDMSMRMNVFPVLGNHDMMAAMMLRKLCEEITEENYATQLDAETLHTLALWQEDGGQTTLDAFRRISPEERAALLEYLEDFPPYEIVIIGEKRFYLVHGGIAYEDRRIPLDAQPLDKLLTARPDYTKQYFRRTYLVTGHTPTLTIAPEYRGKIYRENGHIAVDCGACFDLPLGCIRLEDFAEFYV